MSNKKLNHKIYIAIKKTIKNGQKDLHVPSLGKKETVNLEKCIKDNMVSSIGKFTFDFENSIKKLTGAKDAIAIVNGTCALHLCLHLLGVNEKDEVLMPALNFIASANAVSMVNAKPHFIDSKEDCLEINVNKLDIYLKKILIKKNGINYNKFTKKKIRILMVTHIFGHPDNLDQILRLAKKYNLKIIEDAAEGIGSFYKKKHVGTFGTFGVLSFNGNKTVTTGGGGMILTNNSKLGKLARLISTTAKIPHLWRYRYSHRGFNYRMPNINAAVGCAQLMSLNNFIKSKRKLYLRYKNFFKDIKEVSIMKEPKNTRSNYWLQTLILNKENIILRNQILNFLNKKGIKVRPVWDLLDKNKPYLKCAKMDLSGAKKLEKKLINLPSSPSL